jgi:hypothetical protein
MFVVSGSQNCKKYWLFSDWLLKAIDIFPQFIYYIYHTLRHHPPSGLSQAVNWMKEARCGYLSLKYAQTSVFRKYGQQFVSYNLPITTIDRTLFQIRNYKQDADISLRNMTAKPATVLYELS